MAKKVEGVVVRKGHGIARIDTEEGQRYTVALDPLGVKVDAIPGEIVELEVEGPRVTVLRRKN